MAQKRMIDKKISVSEDIASLSTEAQLLFTWMIPHADDAGLLPFSARSIKALVVPMKDWVVEDIGNHLEDIRKTKLIGEFSYQGDKFWHITNFSEHQTLKKDRQPQTLLKIRLSEHPRDSWNTLYSTGIPFGNHLEPEVSKEVKEVSKEGYKKFLKAKKQIGTTI